MVTRIKLVLDLIDHEPQYLLGDRPPCPDTTMERCESAWMHFKQYTYDTTCATVGHVLAVVRSLYPSIKLEVVNTGFARGVSGAQVMVLGQEAKESVIKLADDLDLFGERENIEQ